MAGEVTVPLLPCASIDEIVSFYEALGFRRTYRQTRPNPYVVVRREDLELHFFGLADFDPADSYGSCIVQVPVAGIPRLTRPRRRRNAGNLSGFSIIDPGGNWIRIFPAGGSSTAPSGKLAKVLDSAVVLGDSKDDPRQAAKILDSALSRSADATVDERVEALAYRAELAVRLGEELFGRGRPVGPHTRRVRSQQQLPLRIITERHPKSILSILDPNAIMLGTKVLRSPSNASFAACTCTASWPRPRPRPDHLEPTGLVAHRVLHAAQHRDVAVRLVRDAPDRRGRRTQIIRSDVESIHDRSPQFADPARQMRPSNVS